MNSPLLSIFALAAAVVLAPQLPGQNEPASDEGPIEGAAGPTGVHNLNGIQFLTNRAGPLLRVQAEGAKCLDRERLHFVPFGAHRMIVGRLPEDPDSGPSGLILGAETGSKVELNFEFTFANGNGDGKGKNDWLNDGTVGVSSLRFGLFWSNLTATTGSKDGMSNDDRGYFGQIAVKGGANASICKECGSDGSLTIGRDVSELPSSSMPGIATNESRYSVSLTVERTGPASVQIGFVMQDGRAVIASAQATDTFAPYTTFDEVVFGLGSAANRHKLEISNIVCQSYLPE